MDAFPGVLMCTPQIIPHFYRGVWIPSIVFDCLICVLSLYTFFRRSPQPCDVLVLGVAMWDVLRDDTFKYYAVYVYRFHRHRRLTIVQDIDDVHC